MPGMTPTVMPRPSAAAGGGRMVTMDEIVPPPSLTPTPAPIPTPSATLASVPVAEIVSGGSMAKRARGRRRWFTPESGGQDREPLESDAGKRAGGSMAPAVFLCATSTLLAGAVAYGTHPAWGQFGHGLDVIVWSRKLQWPLIAMSLVAAMTLVATIIAGRRRAWWLIGLAPVLTLFLHRFATDPTAGMTTVENPAFVSAAESDKFLATDDYVVGITFEGKNYAYPYAALYATPLVVHADHDKRLLVMWSAPANRVVAYSVSRDVRARDFDVVSTPANALLVYDAARGVFVNGLTGRRLDGQKPEGFASAVPTAKLQWWKWRVLHMDTQVMVPAGRLADGAPKGPILPVQPMPKSAAGEGAEQKVVLVGSEKPAAIASNALGGNPLNVTADGVPVVVFRDPESGAVRAFRRRFDDLTPRFRANRDANRKGVVLIDADTNSGWSAAGVAIEARREIKGKRLTPVPAEDELYWAVVKHWYPQLQLTGAEAGPASTPGVIQINGGGATQSQAQPQAQPSTPTSKPSTVLVRPSRPAKPSRKPAQ